MSIHSLFTFSLVCLAAAGSPGPGVLVVLNSGLRVGPKKSLSLIFGLLLGLVMMSVIANLSIGLLIANSMLLYQGLLALGALYLCHMGIKILRFARHHKIEVGEGELVMGWKQGFLVSSLSPKTLMFFIALLPNFIPPHSQSPLLFAALLTAVLLLVTGVTLFSYACFVHFFSHYLKRYTYQINLLTGLLFLAVGLGAVFHSAMAVIA